MSNEISNTNGAGLPAEVAHMAGLVEASNQVPQHAGGQAFLKFTQEGDTGSWQFGADALEPEQDSEWLVNPHALGWGWIAWPPSGGGAPAKVQTIAGQAPMPMRESLPPHDARAQVKELRSMILVCLNGEDEGVQVTWETDSMGGHDVWAEILNLIVARIREGNPEFYPIVRLSTGTPYAAHGKMIKKPRMELLGWADENATPAAPAIESDGTGPVEEEPAPEPEPTPARRRRRRRT